LGNGDGTFKKAKTYGTGGFDAIGLVAIADVNGDKKPDLVVANYCATECSYPPAAGSVGVLLGKGNGTFQPVKTYASGGNGAVSVAVADLNQVAADVNGDGKLDIVVSNWGTPNPATNDGAVTVLLGKGNGTFRPAQTFPSGGAEAPSVAVADVNKDGLLDLVLACVADALNQSSTGVVTVLINKTKTATGSATTSGQ
jgi:hypothetical protein